MKKNQLIDALDDLLSARDAQTRWAAAEDVADRMGVTSILVAEVDYKTQNASWISTNMPTVWMEEYLHEDYLSEDPLVLGLSKQPGRILLHCGTALRDDMSSTKAWSMNHGLKTVGYETLMCSRFGGFSGFGTSVTLAYADETPEQIQQDLASRDLLSALLTTTISPDFTPKDKIYHPRARSPLSDRQREVLSLLAEGMMTSRIAEKLGISETAVTQHFAKARKVLGANTREHALAIAMSRGLISLY